MAMEETCLNCWWFYSEMYKGTRRWTFAPLWKNHNRSTVDHFPKDTMVFHLFLFVNPRKTSNHGHAVGSIQWLWGSEPRSIWGLHIRETCCLWNGEPVGAPNGVSQPFNRLGIVINNPNWLRFFQRGIPGNFRLLYGKSSEIFQHILTMVFPPQFCR